MNVKVFPAFIVSASALLGACSSAVTNYAAGDAFSRTEAMSGSTSTPQQCARTSNAVWVEGASYHECIRYFPSEGFSEDPVPRAIVFMEGDVLSTSGASSQYATWTVKREMEASQLEQSRGGTPYLTLARPGVDGSSGDQNRRRTQYETLVMNAALDKIKARYGVTEFGLVGQSGGGGLVASLIAERRDVLCAVSASGVTSVVKRAREKGRHDDVTGAPFSEVWDPIVELPRVHAMQGFRMFVTSDASDTDVSFSSQNDYVQAAKAAGLPIYQLMVHGAGRSYHQTYRIGNRVVEDCMLGLPTSQILQTYAGMDERYRHMSGLAARARAAAGSKGGSTAVDVEVPEDRDAGVAR